MNGDPYRTPQPTDRRVINRSGQAPQRAEEQPQPQPVREEPPKTQPRSSVSYRSDPPSSDKKSRKGLVWTLSIILIFIVLAVAGWLVWSSANKNGSTGIDAGKYQAVFLTNGQIYFGKLSAYNEESLKLTTGYYPQAKETDEATTSKTAAATTSGGIQLIRLGDEVYGPENEIFISKDQVLHYENLKSDSKVSQLIDQNEKAKK